MERNETARHISVNKLAQLGWCRKDGVVPMLGVRQSKNKNRRAEVGKGCEALQAL